MKIIEFKQIEEIHEEYSLNLNDIINELEKNPNKYQVIAYTDKESLAQRIIVSDNLYENIFLEISDCYIALSEKESGIEYCISSIYPDEIVYENEKVKEFEISETLSCGIDIAINIQIITDKNGEKKNKLLYGEANWESENSENINVRFGKADFLDQLEELENEELDLEDETDEYDDNELDLEDENDEYDEYDDNELDLEDESGEYDDNELELEVENDEFYNEDIDSYKDDLNIENETKNLINEMDEFEDNSEEILEFRVSKNGLDENVSQEDFNNIVANISQISFQMLDDFDKRINEIISIRKGVSKILQSYKNNSLKDNQNIKKPDVKKEKDVER